MLNVKKKNQVIINSIQVEFFWAKNIVCTKFFLNYSRYHCDEQALALSQDCMWQLTNKVLLINYKRGKGFYAFHCVTFKKLFWKIRDMILR